jgi:zinc/manganese transport system permease protein
MNAGTWADVAAMLAPFVMCLVLTGIHGYLGIHVLGRKVIFVDLALAQIAALGTTFAYVLGYDAAHDPADAPAVYWFSLGFAVVGAAVFAITRMRRERVPQEAFIGIVYASASAIAILILAKAPGEGEHIKQMLVGNILLVSWTAILKTAGIYAAIGLFHYLFRKHFFMISLDPERAEREGLAIRWWDFLFYASFGVVITSSVAIAGVLLVFTYLVVPAACAVLLAEGVRARILLAWAMGSVASFAGITLSYKADLPTGPAVVGTFAAALVLLGITLYILRAPSRGRAGIRVAAGAALAVALLGGLFALRKHEAGGVHEHRGGIEVALKELDDPDESHQIEAIHHLEDARDPHALEKFIHMARVAPPESPVLEHLIEALARSANPLAVDALLDVAGKKDLDPDLLIKTGTAILDLHDPRGIPVLIAVLAAPDAPEFHRAEALRVLQRFTGRDAGLAGAKDEAARRAALERWRAWWEGGKEKIRWRENLKKFQ